MRKSIKSHAAPFPDVPASNHHRPSHPTTTTPSSSPHNYPIWHIPPALGVLEIALSNAISCCTETLK